MTIGKIYIAFHKITTLGRPWEVIGGPLDCIEASFGALGASTQARNYFELKICKRAEALVGGALEPRFPQSKKLV